MSGWADFNDTDLNAMLAEGYEHMLESHPGYDGERWSVVIKCGDDERKFSGIGHPSNGGWREVVG